MTALSSSRDVRHRTRTERGGGFGFGAGAGVVEGLTGPTHSELSEDAPEHKEIGEGDAQGLSGDRGQPPAVPPQRAAAAPPRVRRRHRPRRSEPRRHHDGHPPVPPFTPVQESVAKLAGNYARHRAPQA
jgi:hypothetical protein